MNWSEKKKLGDNQKKWLIIGMQTVFCLSFVIFAVILCAMRGGSLFRIYMPTSGYNDELFYYKQVEAIIHNGIPRGYYGYNGSKADFLTFASWNPLIYMPYAVLGKVAGWNLSSPIIMNLLFVSVGLLIFARTEKLKPSSTAMLMFVFANIPAVTHYLMIGMAEALFFAAVPVIGALLKKYWQTGSVAAWVGSIVLISYISVIRPYYFVIFFIPIYCAFKRKKRRILTAFLFIGSVLIYLLSRRFCAPYFIPIVDYRFLEGFRESFLTGVIFLMKKLISGLKMIVKLIIAGVTKRDAAGWGWLLFCMLLFLHGIGFIKALKKKDRYHLFVFGFTIIFGVVMLAAIIMLYKPRTGYRHLLAICMEMAILLVVCNEKTIRYGLCFIMVCINIFALPRGYFKMSFPENAVLERGRMYERLLQNEMCLSNEIGWDNTVVWYLDADWEILYFLPPGFGINCCQKEMDVRKVESQYILAANENYEVAVQEGYELIIAENGWGLFRKGSYDK